MRPFEKFRKFDGSEIENRRRDEYRGVQGVLPVAAGCDREDAVYRIERRLQPRRALFDRCCVKSTPEEAAELRARYEGVRPAWHMNKRMWSDVYFGSDVSDALVCRLVENSYRLVRDSLPAKERETL